MPSWKMIATVAAALAVAALSGCTSRPEPQPVDFGGVDAVQDGARSGFVLTVKVLGIENGTRPLAEAFVGAAAGGQALAKAFTGSDGTARLTLKNGQTFKVVAQAPGWTTEDSGRITLGGADAGSAPVQHCVTTPFVTDCIVVDSDEAPSLHLEGNAGTVSMILFRKEIVQHHAVAAGPHANGFVVAPPDNRFWFPATKKLSDEDELHRLAMLRLHAVHAELRWTNELLSQGDFEVGVGCVPNAPQAASDRGLGQTDLVTQGEVRVELDWTPAPEDYSWSECLDVYAGPMTDTFNSQVDTDVTLKLGFRGRSTILPVNTT